MKTLKSGDIALFIEYIPWEYKTKGAALLGADQTDAEDRAPDPLFKPGLKKVAQWLGETW